MYKTFIINIITTWFTNSNTSFTSLIPINNFFMLLYNVQYIRTGYLVAAFLAALLSDINFIEGTEVDKPTKILVFISLRF